MRAILFLPLAVLAACSGEKTAAPAANSSAAARAAMAVASASAEPAAEARMLEVSNDLYEFHFAYPEEAAAIPALKARLDADLIRSQAELSKEAREEQAEAAKSGFPFRAHTRSQNWKLVTQTPGWLSLSSLVATYSGGAHPNYWFAAILWDKAGGKAQDVADLFTSKQALSAVIRKDFCAELNRQRAKKRGFPIDPVSTDSFDECIDPVAETVILGSSNGRTFNRIGILVSPYEAGPYAEGDYEVTLPVTAQVLAAVKAEYRASFAMK